MDILITKHIMDLLMISVALSIILMAVVQKVKKLSFVTNKNIVWIANLLLSFGIGVPYSMTFYNLNIQDSVWVSLFAFVGAPAIYIALKKQNIINYTPFKTSDNLKANSDVVSIPKANEIKRDDLN